MDDPTLRERLRLLETFPRSLNRFLPLQPLIGRMRQSSFAGNFAHTYLTRSLLIVLGFLTSILCARALGVEARGQLAAAVTLAAILTQLGNLGLHSSNVYVVAKKPELSAALTGNSLWIAGTVGFVLAVSVGAFDLFFPESLGIPRTVLILALATIPASLAGLFLQNLLIGLEQVQRCNRIDLLGRVVVFAVLLTVFFLTGISTESVLIIEFLVLAATVALLINAIKPSLSDRPHFDADVLRENFGYGIKSYLACLFMFLVLRLDLLMVHRMLGDRAAGGYAVAAGIADKLYLLPVVANTVLFPNLAKIQDMETKWHAARLIIAGTSAVLLCSCLAMAAAAPWAIPFLFGSDYAIGIRPLQWLMPAIFLLGFGSQIANLVASKDVFRSMVIYSAFLAVLNVALNFFLIPRFKAEGAAIASMICYGLWIPYNLLLLRSLRQKSMKSRESTGSESRN